MSNKHAGLKFVLALTICLSAFGTSDVPSVALAALRMTQDALPITELDVWSRDATSVQLHWPPVADAAEYTVSRDDKIIGSSVAQVGYFTDFGLRPGLRYRYKVAAYDSSGALIAQSNAVMARTTHATKIRTRYTVLA